ncbi:MAG: hypothetical protein Q8M03_16650 [Legionella sp.]|nr:hypothetical protein [Legionella sp.]
MIQSYSLAFIHAQLIANPSIEEVASELRVTPTALEEHLARFKYKGVPVTAEYLKNTAPQDLINIFGNLYCKPIVNRRPSNGTGISDYSMKQIHALIRISTSIIKVAEALGTAHYTLINQLENFKYKDQSLTFEQWQNLAIEDAQKEAGAKYPERLLKIKKNLSDYTFREIHSCIRAATTFGNAATAVKVSDRSLRIFLGKTKLELTYELLKDNEEKKLREQFGDDAYDKPLEISYRPIWTRTLAEIRAKALAIKEIHPSAYTLGVHGDTLRKYLAYVSDEDNNPLTFEKLKQLNPDEDFWKDRFNKPLGELYTCPPSRKRKRSVEDLSPSNDEDQQRTPPFPTRVEPNLSTPASALPTELPSNETSVPKPVEPNLSTPAPALPTELPSNEASVPTPVEPNLSTPASALPTELPSNEASVPTPVAGYFSAIGTRTSQLFFSETPAPKTDILSKLFDAYAREHQFTG